MARELYARYVLKGRLKTETALHVGGLGLSLEDAPMSLDGLGRPCIFGTSLAGAIKAWLSAEGWTDRDLSRWWGDNADDCGASLIVTEDAPICLPAGSALAIRDGVGIDRITGTAAQGFKYDILVAPRGSTFKVEISADVPLAGDAGQCEKMLKDIAGALNGGLIRFGACRTRGMGRVAPAEEGGFKLVCYPLGGRNEMLDFLQGRGGRQIELDNAPSTDRCVKVRISWKPAGPMMVKAGSDGVAVDILPLLETADADGRLALLLPGSSIKGAMRSRAEGIVRTLAGVKLEPVILSDQVQVPIADLLFGSVAGTEKGAGAKEEEKPKEERLTLSEQVFGIKPGSGTVSFSDCYGEQKIEPALWKSVSGAKDEDDLNRALPGTAVSFQDAWHVAVDRWTNAVKDGALYQVLEPHLADWEPIEISFDPVRLRRASGGDELLDACKALLLFVLRDFSRGDIPLGFAVNRGMGDISVAEITVSGGGLDCRLENGEIRPDAGLDSLSKSWAEALAQVEAATGEVA